MFIARAILPPQSTTVVRPSVRPSSCDPRPRATRSRPVIGRHRPGLAVLQRNPAHRDHPTNRRSRPMSSAFNTASRRRNVRQRRRRPTRFGDTAAAEKNENKETADEGRDSGDEASRRRWDGGDTGRKEGGRKYGEAPSTTFRQRRRTPFDDEIDSGRWID